MARSHSLIGGVEFREQELVQLLRHAQPSPGGLSQPKPTGDGSAAERAAESFASGFIGYRRLTMNLPRAQAEIYAGWFRCLADPTRIEILSLLAGERRPLSVGEIVERVDVGQSTVSEHLRRLAETCFVFVEHRGTSSYFRINESCIESFPSAAEFVMGSVAQDRLPAPRPGATSRRRRGERHSGHAPVRETRR
jgi:ArsR family transcriptional regulator, arsenate/arsenite/antimonite-responsive transcriptional repressor